MSLEIVPNTPHQWLFGANNQHSDQMIETKLADRLELKGIKIYVFAASGCAGISGGDKKFRAVFTLDEFPGKSVFASAGTEKENVKVGQCNNVVNVINNLLPKYILNNISAHLQGLGAQFQGIVVHIVPAVAKVSFKIIKTN